MAYTESQMITVKLSRLRKGTPPDGDLTSIEICTKEQLGELDELFEAFIAEKELVGVVLDIEV